MGHPGAERLGQDDAAALRAGRLPARRRARVILGSGVQPGYFDQLLECLDDDTQVLEAVRPPHKEFVEQQRRDLLARFGITGDLVFQKVGSLSGGERNRVALARLAALDPNFLMLDEPTNHLDLWAREALERAIREFDGHACCSSATTATS